MTDLVSDHTGQQGKRVTSMSSAVFACHSAACAPPPAGTGGSKGGGSKSSSGGGKGSNKDGDQGDLKGARKVRDELKQAISFAIHRSPEKIRFYEYAHKGASEIADGQMSKKVAMQKIKDAERKGNMAYTPERKKELWGWAHGARQAAEARWG